MNPGQGVTFLSLLERKFPQYSKPQLKAKILAGAFRVDGETVYDPQRPVSEHAHCKEMIKKYVSRGGLKLEHALSRWRIPVRGKVFIDAGASTGGFTDCLLQAGARTVHAVDVGYNQLDYTLRIDNRVDVHERKNIMDCTGFEPVPHAAVADLSFRSITAAAEHIVRLTAEKWAVVLIKPQFERGEKGETKSASHFDGVIRDARDLRRTVLETARRLHRRGLQIVHLCKSPILGRKGNLELLAYIQQAEAPQPGGITDSMAKMEDLVDRALI